MDESKNQKREAESYNYSSAKRAKNSSDDQDSESISIGSFSGSNSYSPRDSGYRDTVIHGGSGSGSGSGSGEDSLCLDQNARNTDQSILPGRVRILEEKVNWIGRELQLIREMLQFVTKMMPFGSCLPHYLSNENGLNFQRKNVPSALGNFSNDCFFGQSDYSKLKEQSNYPKFKSPYHKQSVPAPKEEQGKVAKNLQSSDDNQEVEEGRFGKRDKSTDSQNSDDATYSGSEQRPYPKATGGTSSKVMQDTVSAIDIIKLWEHGTSELAPMKSWNTEQLAGLGEKLTLWKQIVNLFKEDCDGDMEKFIHRYSDSEGNVKSVPEIAARSLLGKKSSSNSFSADYQRAKEIACSTEVQPDDGTGRQHQHNWHDRSKQTSPCFILPRKINGRKVSARDVIRIWEEGQGRIPPVKFWTANQKLRQQSKISRWKKIVDIFKNHCNGDMKEFQLRFSDGYGTLLPIAAIIAKFEQKNPSMDSMRKAAIGSMGTSLYSDSFYSQSDDSGNDITSSNEEKPSVCKKTESYLKDMNERDEEYKTVNPKLYTQLVNVRNSVAQDKEKSIQTTNGLQETAGNTKNHMKLDGKGFVWKEMLTCYSKDEFCREYINSRSSVGGTADEYEAKSKTSINSALVETAIASSEQQSTLPDKIAREDLSLPKQLKFTESHGVQPAKQLAEANYSPSVTSAADVEKNNTKKAQTPNEEKQISNGQMVDTTNANAIERKLPSDHQSKTQNLEMDIWRKDSGQYSMASGSVFKSQAHPYGSIGLAGGNMEPYYPISLEKLSRRYDLDDQQQKILQALPDTNDALEVIALWEAGFETCPPVALLYGNESLSHHPKLYTWKQFMDIFNHVCAADKSILQRKFVDEEGHLLPVTEIVKRYFTIEKQSFQDDSKAAAKLFYPANARLEGTSYVPQQDSLGDKISNSIYVLPRKINGRKVSAKDVIYIWNNGFKNMPPVRSWLPHQKIRQQSKISRWKKIVEIFENDCNRDLKTFEAKYSNRSNELLPIAAIISKYDAEQNTEGYSSPFQLASDSIIHRYQKASLV